MERGMSADQLLTALWRRKALVGAITLAVFAVGAAIVLSRPSIYQASAVVRVEPQRPSEEMVQRTVSELIEQRLLTVRQELMARPVLEKAIKEMNLYPDVVSDDGIEAAVDLMRKDLDVKVDGENAFEITYSSRSPELAAKVANRLPAIFAEETLKLRQAQAQRATQLFQDEIKNLGQAVTAWEKRIAEFKVAHMGELPEQMEMNMRAVERLSAQMQTKSEELRVAETRRSELVRARLAADTEAGRLQAAENAMTTTLVGAKTQWTEEHPEVKRLETELSQLKAKREEAEGRMVAERQERARAAQIVEQVQKEIGELQKQAAVYQARLDNTPRWAHELGVLQRDYEISRTKYQSLVSRRVEAELAEGLELKSAKSLFNVISPAGTPSVPAKPDRVGGLLIAALVALGLGVLTTVVTEMRDDSVRDGQDLRDRLTLPVLAVVPDMQGARTEKRVLAPPPPGLGRNSVQGTSSPLN